MKKTAGMLLAMLLALLFAFPAGAEKKITLSFTGDVTLGGEDRVMREAGSFRDYAERMGYGYFLRNFVPLFSSDDLTVVNLEGVLSDSTSGKNKSKVYVFRGPSEYAQILTAASVEACAVSNNHVNQDYGTQGYRATLRTLEEYGIQYFGNDSWYIFEKDGVRIALYALVSSKINNSTDKMADTARRLREEEGVDAIILCFHAGQEYKAHRREDQERYARMAVRKVGADLVIMHHSHVLQGIDILQNRYVFYSLGNFCFGGNKEIRALNTMAIQADLFFDDDGTYTGQTVRLYPAHVASTAEKEGDANDYQPKLVTGEGAAEALQLVQDDTPFEIPAFDEEKGYVELPFLPAEFTE